MTKFFQWIETRLDDGGWIRRSYLVAATVMTWKFIVWAMEFAAVNPQDPTGKATLIAAIGVPLSAVTGFAFQNYLTSRK